MGTIIQFPLSRCRRPYRPAEHYVSPQQFGKTSGLGEQLVRKLMKMGMPMCKVGNKSLVVVSEVYHWLSLELPRF